MATIRIATFGLLWAAAAVALAANPAAAAALKVSVNSLKNGKMMPSKYAFCVPAAQGHTAGGPNISPRISWSKGPAGTKSYAIILHDATRRPSSARR